MIRSAVSLTLLSLALACGAQARPAASHSPSLAPALKPYVSCKLPNGAAIVEIKRLPAENRIRTAQTVTGPKQVRLLDGVGATFAYPNSDAFANVKVEQLPADRYDAEKADLTSEFEKILSSSDESSRNYALKPMLNGFEITGLDKAQLQGNVLSIYLLFDNLHAVATTIYFLNQKPEERKFASMQQYGQLRDRFLNDYTSCVRKQLEQPAPAPRAKAKPRPAPRTRAHRSR